MTGAPQKATQVGLGQPGLAAAWHDYFLTENRKLTPPVESDEASLQAKIDIQDGKRPLPAGSIVRLDCNPAFQPPITQREDGYLIAYPSWRWKLYNGVTGELVREGTIGNQGNYALDGFVGIKSPETPDSLFNQSLGYAPNFQLDRFPFQGKLEITVECPGMVSPALLIPWVEQG